MFPSNSKQKHIRSLQKYVDAATNIDDLLGILKHTLRHQIANMDAATARNVYHNTLPIDHVLPIDVLQLVLSFGDSDQYKCVSKAFYRHSMKNKNTKHIIAENSISFQPILFPPIPLRPTIIVHQSLSSQSVSNRNISSNHNGNGESSQRIERQNQLQHSSRFNSNGNSNGTNSNHNNSGFGNSSGWDSVGGTGNGFGSMSNWGNTDSIQQSHGGRDGGIWSKWGGGGSWVNGGNDAANNRSVHPSRLNLRRNNNGNNDNHNNSGMSKEAKQMHRFLTVLAAESSTSSTFEYDQTPTVVEHFANWMQSMNGWEVMEAVGLHRKFKFKQSEGVLIFDLTQIDVRTDWLQYDHNLCDYTVKYTKKRLQRYYYGRFDGDSREGKLRLAVHQNLRLLLPFRRDYQWYAVVMFSGRQ